MAVNTNSLEFKALKASLEKNHEMVLSPKGIKRQVANVAGLLGVTTKEAAELMIALYAASYTDVLKELEKMRQKNN